MLPVAARLGRVVKQRCAEVFTCVSPMLRLGRVKALLGRRCFCVSDIFCKVLVCVLRTHIAAGIIEF